MRSPRHLWSGAWRSESEAARRESEADAARLRLEAERRARPGDGGPQQPRRRSLRLAPGVAALLGAAVVAAAFGIATLAGGGGGAGTDPLPAVSSAPLKPRPGQTRVGAIYAAASPAVVSVRTTAGSGTGFLIDGDGTLVTNAHVAGSDKRVIVRFGTHSRPLDADVLGTDPSSDIAVLSVAPRQVPNGVKPLQLADSRSVRVGDSVVAIGNPFGLDRTATEGIVSGLGRQIQAPNGFEIDEVIQTDAPINPGNSGGPLLDSSAHVIGVNSQIATAGSQGNVGIGFAVPSNTVRDVVPRLERGERIERPYLGISSAPASPQSPNGVQVRQVVPGGPADAAGIRVGDVVTRIDGRPIADPSEVSRAIAGKQPGDKVEVEFERGGRPQSVTVTLGTRPNHTP